jgi:membrane protease subunit HflC
MANGLTMRIRRVLRIGLGGAAILAILWSACAHVTRDRETALVLRFGRPVRVDRDPGLHVNLPWPIDVTVRLDMRHQVLETGLTEMLTRDKKNIVVMSYALWHVEDPLRFVQAVGSMDRAPSALEGLLANAAIGVMGHYDLSALTSTTSSDLHTDEIERDLLAAAAPTASQSYGMVIDRVALMRLSLPEQNISYVFDQMRAERKQYAARFSADGQKEASRIRAETSVEIAHIQAGATEEAARTRGEADAEAARIYAEAHSQDPELYRFTRSLESLGKVVGDKTTLVLRTDAEPLSLLKGQKP